MRCDECGREVVRWVLARRGADHLCGHCFARVEAPQAEPVEGPAGDPERGGSPPPGREPPNDRAPG